MSAISNFQYVTLVTQGGTPVRLADQYGANLPTTGNGSLVFSNGAVLTNVTITGTVIAFPLGAPNGVVSAPSIYFGTPDRGLFSQGASDISFAANGSLLASITQNASIFHFQTNNLQINLFSDTAGEVAIQGTDPSAGTHNLALNKYGANVSIGEAAAPVAGGSVTSGALSFTSDAVSLVVGSGLPTVTARSGSLYLRDDATSQPPYFNSGVGLTATWQQLVGLTATQTLTNKTLTSPVLNSPTFTGTFTVNGQIVNNEGTIVASSPAQFIQTWNNAAVAFTGLQVSIVNTASGSPSFPFQALVGGVNVFSVDKFGQISNPGNAFHGGTVFIVNGTAIPAGGTQDIGLLFSSVSHFGIIFGSGAPTASQAQGSIYLRSDGLPYYNTNGTTGWDRLVGLAATNAFTGNNSWTGGTQDFTASSILVPTLAANTNTTGAASTAYVVAALANLKINVQVITSSGTYTPSANLVYCIIECWGGGGGGGGTASSGASLDSSGGGGGAGSYSRKFATAATIGVSQVATIGAAGAAGAAGNNAGGTGGATSIGAICIANGGTGGGGSTGTTGTFVAGGLGGTVGTGDVTSTGMAGMSGGVVVISGSAESAAGGSSLVGGGGRGVTMLAATAAGEAGTGHGSGGSGGACHNNNGTAAGGAGTTGYIVITEFLSH